MPFVKPIVSIDPYGLPDLALMAPGAIITPKAKLPNLLPLNKSVLLQKEEATLVSPGGVVLPQGKDSGYYVVRRVAADIGVPVKVGDRVVVIPGAALVRVPEVEPAAFFVPEEALLAINQG